MFVDNIVTSSHQSKTMALNYSSVAQEKKIKRNKDNNKWQLMG
jgi:hypothetical protein